MIRLFMYSQSCTNYVGKVPSFIFPFLRDLEVGPPAPRKEPTARITIVTRKVVIISQCERKLPGASTRLLDASAFIYVVVGGYLLTLVR